MMSLSLIKTWLSQSEIAGPVINLRTEEKPGNHCLLYPGGILIVFISLIKKSDTASEPWVPSILQKMGEKPGLLYIPELQRI